MKKPERMPVHRNGSPKDIGGNGQAGWFPEQFGENVGENAGEKFTNKFTETEDLILDLLRQDRSITTEELSKTIGISKRAILKQIDKLKDRNHLRRVGPAKGGHWEVMEKSELH